MADALLALHLRHRKRSGRPIRLTRPKKWLHPLNAERTYEASILRIVDVVQEATKNTLLPALPGLVAQAARLRGDSWSDDIASLTNSVRLRVDQEVQNEERIAVTAAMNISDFNQKEWRAIVKQAIGIDLYANEPWLRDELKSWARENANLITTMEEGAIRQVSQWTQKGLREGWSHRDIAKNIEERFDVSRSWAKFIARDQTGKLNGDLTQARQTESGVKAYFWRDSRDERVRGNPGGLYPKAEPSHWDRNGQRFLWSKPPAGGHPGHDYNCRCTSEPDLRGLLEAFS